MLKSVKIILYYSLLFIRVLNQDSFRLAGQPAVLAQAAARPVHRGARARQPSRPFRRCAIAAARAHQPLRSIFKEQAFQSFLGIFFGVRESEYVVSGANPK